MKVSLKVECYAGYRGEETPRRFYLGERCIEVNAVVDRGLTPTHRDFKVEGNDGRQYLLRHDTDSGQWSLANHRSERRQQQIPRV